MEDICGLLTYINGQLDDESDDLIDDASLYFLFVRLAAQAGEISQLQQRDRLIGELLADYPERIPGSRKRIERVLQVMLTAWQSARLRTQAEKMLRELSAKPE